MSKKTKALVYNLIGFAIIFFAVRFAVASFTTLKDLWIPLVAFIIGTVLAPKFQAVATKDGEKLFAKWIFVKGIKEVN